jgi:predicted transposase YbfD/YdcC
MWVQTREHWKIENQLDWVKDVIFEEDTSFPACEIHI